MPSLTDVYSLYHEYDLFLLNQEIDTPSENLNFQNTHVCENGDVIIIHATNLSCTFALPQYTAEHNCEDLDPTDAPSIAQTAIQATSDKPFSPRSAHNTTATMCNQSQYPYPNHNSTLPQFMAPTNSEALEPTDTTSTVPSTLEASYDHTFNPKCAHNVMEAQCNQPQYLIPLNKICAHIPS